MKYKAIISDLDWTLLNDEHKISEYTKNVIRKLISKGVKFIIATGRHHEDALCFKEQLGADTYLISGNGSKVHDRNNNEVISHNISKELTEKLLDIKVSNNVVRGVYKGNKWFTERNIPDFDEYHTESGFRPEIIDFNSLKGEEIAKIFYITADDETKKELDEIREKVASSSNWSEQLHVTASLPNCLEIMDKNATKGNAVKEILARDGIKCSEAIAFGDGLNDKEMLTVVGKGIIMGNGSEKLKELLPEMEVIGTSSEDSEARYLAKIFKI